MGSPGSGKSTVARILAKKLNKPSIDIDNDILEPMWGVKISEKVILHSVRSMFCFTFKFQYLKLEIVNV